MGDDRLEDFAFRIRSLARELLPGAGNAEEVHASMRRLTEEAEREVRAAAASDEKIACAAGCGACCLLNVAVLFPEAVAAVGYLRESLPPEERRDTTERLETLYWRLAWLDGEDPPQLDEPCAFLDQAGHCRIYPVRPLLCRSVTSTDAEGCRQALALQARGIFRPILMDLHQKEVMETAFRELALALEEAGLDARGSSLTASVRLLLHDAGAVENYLAGTPLPAG